MDVETEAALWDYVVLGLIALAHWYIDIYEWILTIEM